jgi:hypothetical protein
MPSDAIQFAAMRPQTTTFVFRESFLVAEDLEQREREREREREVWPCGCDLG